MQYSPLELPQVAQRRAAVVSRHPATLRHVAQALGVAGLAMRQAIGPSFLPKSQPGEFDLVLVDLDIDPTAPPQSIIDAVWAACPQTPVLVLAGINTRHRLIQSLATPSVRSIVPKLGTWIDLASGAPTVAEGPDEQDLAVALRRLLDHSPIAVGPMPYLLGGTVIEERVIGSSSEKESALADVVRLAETLGLVDEKLRRVETTADELLLNAIYDAPQDETGKPKYATLDRRTPVTLGAQAQVRLRFGCDGRSFVISVGDRFGGLTRTEIARHIARVLESRGPRPRGGTGGAGLGLVLCFSAVNQLIMQGSPGRFTEVTGVVHVAGSNRAALSRGTSLHLYLG